MLLFSIFLYFNICKILYTEAMQIADRNGNPKFIFLLCFLPSFSLPCFGFCCNTHFTSVRVFAVFGRHGCSAR